MGINFEVHTKSAKKAKVYPLDKYPLYCMSHLLSSSPSVQSLCPSQSLLTAETISVASLSYVPKGLMSFYQRWWPWSLMVGMDQMPSGSCFCQEQQTRTHECWICPHLWLASVFRTPLVFVWLLRQGSVPWKYREDDKDMIFYDCMWFGGT